MSRSRTATAPVAPILHDARAKTLAPLLNRATAAARARDPKLGAELALQALKIDGDSARAWHVLAICQEKSGALTAALDSYDRALKLDPDDPEIAHDLGRLAYAMGMKEIAEQLFAEHLARNPGSIEATNNLACARRDQHRFEEAIETLRPAIYANPECALLWNTLATVLYEQGEMAQALGFFDEALRLDPAFAKARYNRANCRLVMGDAAAAVADCEAALTGEVLAGERAMMRFSHALMLLANGELGRGWDAYEARVSPDHADAPVFALDLPTWTPEVDLAGKRILLVGEQGLGDEVMFANVVPDVLKAVGPEGQVFIAVEPRLVEVFRRSFPEAVVDRHDTYKVDHYDVRAVRWIGEEDRLDLWTPIGSLLRRFRRSLADFPAGPFLTPDPGRVEHWRHVLASLGEGPKVGLIWKSFLKSSSRSHRFSPFEQWAPVLQTPGVRFVNLQYGDCAAELAEAKHRLGVEVWRPPGIDLKDDLDDVAALGCALDLTLGPATATTNLVGAAGAPLWIVSIPGGWTRLGTAGYPWYLQARVFTPEALNDWAPTMRAVAEALGRISPSR